MINKHLDKLLLKLRSQGARRTVWTLLNEGIDAGSNLFLTIWVAREVSAHDFGLFSLVFVGIQMATVIGRSAATNPMMIKFAASSKRFSPGLAADVMGVSLAIGLMTSALAVVLACFATPAAGILLSLAAVAPALLLQDCCIYIFYSRQQQISALRNNLVWAGLQIPMFVIATFAYQVHETWAFLALWGAAAYVAVIVSAAEMHAWPMVAHCLRWFRAHRPTILDLTSMAALSQISLQGVTWILGFVVNLASLAGFRAGQTPFGILRILVQGIQPMVLAEGSRIAVLGAKPLRNLITLWAFASAVFAVILGFLLVLMPSGIGDELLGDSWKYAKPILIPITAITVGNFFLLPAETGLNALRATRLAALLKPILIALDLASALVGSFIGGLLGATVALAVSAIVAALIMWLAFMYKLREHSTATS